MLQAIDWPSVSGSPAVFVPAEQCAAPLIVAAHGAGGIPEWHCQHFAALTRGRVAVVCPRGVALAQGDDSAFYFPDHLHLKREVEAIFQTLRRQYAEYVDFHRVTYAGYSQGATMGALMITDLVDPPRQLLLVEGGFSEWNVARANAYRARGGERIAFVCGTSRCDRGATQSVEWLHAGGIAAKHWFVADAGHTPAGGVSEATRTALDWLDER